MSVSTLTWPFVPDKKSRMDSWPRARGLPGRGVPTAVLISPAELEDLEDALALARLERDRATGRSEATIPHDEARRALLDAVGRGE